MSKIRNLARESAEVFRIIYIILVQTAQTGLQSRQVRLYSAVCIESILLILFVYSMYWFLMFGCALDDNCAAAQGY